MTAAEQLGLSVDERTRFKVRVQHENSETGEDTITWLKHNTTIEQAQEAYVNLREHTGLGMNGFGEGEVFDEQGQHVARISYNGRVWTPGPAAPDNVPVLETPM